MFPLTYSKPAEVPLNSTSAYQGIKHSPNQFHIFWKMAESAFHLTIRALIKLLNSVCTCVNHQGIPIATACDLAFVPLIATSVNI